MHYSKILLCAVGLSCDW